VLKQGSSNPLYELQKSKKFTPDQVGILKLYFEHLKSVGYYPHAGQMPVIKMLLSPTSKVNRVLLECGRNFGKSTMGAIWIVAHALIIENAKTYIIASTKVLTKEIYYDSMMIERMIPAWANLELNKGEMRYSLYNNSYIKLNGSDIASSVRGYKPTALLCDEFQDWRPKTWHVLQPNLLAHGATTLQVGTCQKEAAYFFYKEGDFVKAKMESGDERYYHMTRTVYDNPTLSLSQINETKEELLEKGRADVWRGEYLCERVMYDFESIYPQFTEEHSVITKEEFDRRYPINKRYLLQPYTVFDPSNTRWAATLNVLDRERMIAYTVASFTEQNAADMSCGVLWPKIRALELAHYMFMQDAERIYDEAAKLWSHDMIALGADMRPTSKAQNSKDNNIATVRDMLLTRRLLIVGEQPDLVSEFINYRMNKGKIHKVNDDLMDTILYFAAESGFEVESNNALIEDGFFGKVEKEEPYQNLSTQEKEYVKLKNDTFGERQRRHLEDYYIE
jgi:hypothetical protein